MPALSKPKRQPLASENPAWRIFTRTFKRGDLENQQRIAALWERHFAGDARADQSLFEAFAPLVLSVAGRLKFRLPSMFTEPLDDMLSDGSLGLCNAIRTEKWGHWAFVVNAQREIRWALFREHRARRWGGEKRNIAAGVAAEIRGRLTGELGRLPTPEEMASALHGKIANPMLYVHGHPDIYARSQLGTEDKAIPEPGQAAPPDRRAIDAETIRLASRGLSAQQKTILKMLLAGASRQEIGKKLGMTKGTTLYELNGLLWLCRSHAELARYLGVKEEPMPDIGHCRLPKVSKLGPAPLADDDGHRRQRAAG
jgi:DNA-directed RNA polymerase specialized sigma subunit